jgi:hypothetical protein
MWLEGLVQLKNSVTSLGIKPHDLPAYSIVPQPVMLQCAPLTFKLFPASCAGRFEQEKGLAVLLVY